MKCKILFNYFEDTEDLQYSDFYLDLFSINAYYLLENAIVVIIFGTEYCLLYEKEIHEAIYKEMSKRNLFRLN
jgi:hypothetical protein